MGKEKNVAAERQSLRPEGYTQEKTVALEIDAPARFCYAVMRDLESYPDFVRGMKETRVLERGPGEERVMVEFVIGFLRWRVRYVLNYAFDEASLFFRWDYVEGDLENVTGYYKFEELGPERCRATYRLESFEVGVNWHIPRRVLEFAEKIMMRRSVADLKRRAEKDWEASRASSA